MIFFCPTNYIQFNFFSTFSVHIFQFMLLTSQKLKLCNSLIKKVEVIFQQSKVEQLKMQEDALEEGSFSVK